MSRSQPTEIISAFRERFRSEPRLFWAPGRVNLIGEHTDYNDGWVLPIAIDLGTVTAARAREDRILRVHSRNLGESIEICLDDASLAPRGVWFDYVEGMARSIEERGVALRGADLMIDSTVPLGAGLSSSAAIEISVGKALLDVSDARLENMTLALSAQSAEHKYVGIKSGIMDQYIAVFASEHSALLIDCRTLESNRTPMNLSGFEVIVCDTKVKHALSSSEYNTRREECEAGVEALRAHIPGIRALRDVSHEQFERFGQFVPETIRKRCRHVITENDRTLRAASALEGGRVNEFGDLMFQSHKSLKDDYEVSCAELDLMVDLAASIDGLIGARMTGGGFGGCTVNIVASSAASKFKESIQERYRNEIGIDPPVISVSVSAGARELIL
ncbi:MAG: galactokinase [Blastocatellia bacterium]